MRDILAWLREHDWQQTFDSGALARGEAYADQDRVTFLQISGDAIEAHCTGNAEHSYRTTLSLSRDGQRLLCSCSCPVGLYCKHGVAAIFNALASSSRPTVKPSQPGLSRALQQWLHELPKMVAESESYPADEANRLYYVLQPDATVSLHKIRLDAQGQVTEAKPYQALREAISRQPRFLLASDLRIARVALGGSDYRYGNQLRLAGELGAELLPLMAATGRLFLDVLDVQPLRWGQPLEARFRWSLLPEGGVGREWQVKAGGDVVVLETVTPLHYLDLGNALVGKLECDQSPQLASHLSRLPTVPPEQTEAFSEALQALAPQLPPPRALAQRDIDDLAPVAQLTLGSHLHTNYDTRSARMVTQAQHRAGLAFDYAGSSVHGKPPKPQRLRVRAGEEYLSIARQPRKEQACRDRLLQLGFKVALRQSQALPANSAEMFELADDRAWLEFIEHGVDALRSEGWNIDIRPGFHFDLSPVEGWFADIEEAPQGQWFDLEMGIMVDGQRVSLLPVLLGLLKRNPHWLSGDKLRQRRDDEQLHLQLEARRASDGRPLQVMLPYGRVRPLLGMLADLYVRDPEASSPLRLQAPDAARLAELSELPLEWQGGEAVREFARRLQHYADAPAAPPAGLKAALRHYQLEGLSWMQTLRQLGVGGILGDDMGLGKTLQTLAHLQAEKEAGRLDRPSLVVMPTSLIPNWQDEAKRFVPTLRVLALHGPQRQRHFAELDQYDLLLSTYALLPRDIDALRQLPLHVLVFDEAQNLKNPSSKAAIAARDLQARQRLCLSGTPLENHLGELWALFDLLLPGWLGDSKRFAQDYRTPIEKQGATHRLEHLRARIRPFLLRRRKEQVARELPAKTEILQWVELSDAQRDHYETVRLAMDKKVREAIDANGLARSQLVILDALLKLRQVCCDLRLVKEDDGKRTLSQSAKLAALVDMLEELLGSGRRVLVFSQFTSMLALIGQELKKRRQPYALLTGDTTDRRTPVERFQKLEVPLFLISLKAGGTGLNLTAADTVIHYDPWWNPAVENQATDRAYRIGQDKPVFVYKLIARGTVEERIQQLQQRKSELARGVLEQEAESDWRLQPDDLDALFAPLP